MNGFMTRSPRLLLSRLLVGVLLISGGVALGQPTVVKDLDAREEQAFKQAAAIVAPAVVRIQTVGGLDRVGRVLTGTGATTGLIVSPDGYVISSAFNFASRPTSVLVTLADGRTIPATVVANDRARMLTLLKIPVQGLKPAKIVPRKELRVGQWAIALGRTYDSPLPNLSVGILSALNRVWGRAVQTDAKVSPANYGGPLVDIQGRVIGVLVPLSQRQTGRTAGVEWYDSGIGFAIPATDIMATLKRLKAGEDLLPGLMGVTLKPGDQFSTAAVIDRVRYNSPAEKAGFQPGDKIESIDGQSIQRLVQIRNVLGNKYAGETIRVAVRRVEQLLEKNVLLVGKLAPYEQPFLGILPVRPRRGDDTAGVTVRGLLPGSPATQARVLPGDRIIKLETSNVTDATSLLDGVSRHRVNDLVRLTVLRNKQEQTVEVRLGSIPDSVPAVLEASSIPAPQPVPADLPRTGRFSEPLVGHEHNYWAYVPEAYNPDHNYGLVVWVHPGGDTMEADIHDLWKPICDERGLILIGPRAAKVAGWSLNEAGFVEALVKQMQERYHVDRSRIVLHSYSDGARFAYHLAFKFRDLFRGVAGASEPVRIAPPENRPEFRLQFHLSCGDRDNLYRLVQQSRGRLKAMKFPVRFMTSPGEAHSYPPVPIVDDIGRWIDLLDRI